MKERKRIAVVGNSGSGKSTLASMLARAGGYATLDLDSIVWEPNQIAVARETAAQKADVAQFCGANDAWVVEGCYASLIAVALTFEPYLIVLDPGHEQCIANCKARPWEAHKYASKEEQDAKLEFLLAWVKDYYERDDDMSLAAHQQVYAAYDGEKLWQRSLPDDDFTLDGT